MLSRVYCATILQQYFNLQGKIKLVLDCRKGFIKLALRCPTKDIKFPSLLYFLPEDVDEEIREGIKNRFLGRFPKLWVGGGPKSKTF